MAMNTCCESRPEQHSNITPIWCPRQVNHIFVFDFEKQFVHQDKLQWVLDHRYVPFGAVAIYVITIFAIQKYMATRSAFELRTPLAFWNVALAFFNICAAQRAVQTMVFDIREFGFYYTICDSKNFAPSFSFWAWLFLLSKFTELGDTMFVVLRKRKLIFLHWYHHVTVLLMTWQSFADSSAPSKWMFTMNAVIHFPMYTYYAVSSAGFRIARWIAMTITFMQIAQMIFGFSLSLYVYFLLMNDFPCDQSLRVSRFSLFIYLTYMLLFVNFFFKTYIATKTDSRKSK